MTISLSPKLEKLVQDKVASGQYESAEAVVAEALQLLQERDENHTPSDDSQAEEEEEQRPIWKVFQEITKDIPKEAWEKLPPDGALEHDHYIYGTPKRYS